MGRGRAYSPCGISSMFQVCIPPGAAPPEQVGSRGGGFCISKGVIATVKVEDSGDFIVETLVNGKPVDMYVAKKVVEKILDKHVGSREFKVKIEQQIEVPIGCGFGTSAASALAVGLALNKALNLNLNITEIARIAHIVEVECYTGLGTVSGLITGGVVLVVKPGAPREDKTLRIPVPNNIKIVAAASKPMSKKDIILSEELVKEINVLGKKLVDEVQANPTFKVFLKAAKTFTQQSKLITPWVKEAIKVAEESGAIIALQNMIGEAVHAVVIEDSVDSVSKALEKITENVIVTDIYKGKVDSEV